MVGMNPSISHNEDLEVLRKQNEKKVPTEDIIKMAKKNFN